MVLVENGKSDYVIVLNGAASPSERWAAEELAGMIKQMSAAELKIRQAEGPVATGSIVLGFGSAADGLGVKAEASLSGDGYVIKTVGPTVIIAGGQPRGTMYGVFTLLEKLGVRWWTPDETTVPQMKTIRLPAMDLKEVPRLEYRDMLYAGMHDDRGQAWMAHNKVNGMA